MYMKSITRSLVVYKYKYNKSNTIYMIPRIYILKVKNLQYYILKVKT